MKNKILCIDFDGTITKTDEYIKEAELQDHAVEVLIHLKNNGYKIIIWSCRANPQINNYHIRLQHMKDTLYKYKIPYDEIAIGPKPLADYYIDDKAIQFTSWIDILNLLN